MKALLGMACVAVALGINTSSGQTVTDPNQTAVAFGTITITNCRGDRFACDYTGYEISTTESQPSKGNQYGGGTANKLDYAAGGAFAKPPIITLQIASIPAFAGLSSYTVAWRAGKDPTHFILILHNADKLQDGNSGWIGDVVIHWAGFAPSAR